MAFIAAKSHYTACGIADEFPWPLYLLKISERLFCGLGLFTVGIKLEISLELGDGFVLFLQLLRYLGEGEVSGGVVGLDADRIFSAEVGALVVFVVQIKLCDGEVLIDTFVVGLDSFHLGKFAVNGGAFRRIRRIAFGGSVVVGRSVGIVAAGAGAAATGVIAGKLGRRLRGEWVFCGGIGRSGCWVRGVGWSCGLGGPARKGELLGGGWFPCGLSGWGAGLGCLI
jgi:hypothetical protein